MSANTVVWNLVYEARIVAAWSARDVLDYLGQHYADILEYPADADTETMRVCDDENRARAVLYRADVIVNGRTLDMAGRALEYVKEHAAHD